MTQQVGIADNTFGLVQDDATQQSLQALALQIAGVKKGFVTSVGFSAPLSMFSVAGSPVTSAATIALTLAVQAANTALMGGTSGGSAIPGFRALVKADIAGLLAAGDVGAVSSVTTQAANNILAGPTSGGALAPAFRLLVKADIAGLLAASDVNAISSVTTQTANFLLAGPTTGAAAAPTFRALVIADMPATVARTDVTNALNGDQQVTAGNVLASTAGKGFRTGEGSNAKQGTAVLVTGTKVVANTSVTATSRIFLTSQVDGGAPGWLRVSTRSVGTSFTILSSSATDTSTVAYEIFEPA